MESECAFYVFDELNLSPLTHDVAGIFNITEAAQLLARGTPDCVLELTNLQAVLVPFPQSGAWEGHGRHAQNNGHRAGPSNV